MSEAAELEIKRLEDERCRALVARDFKTLDALVDDDLVHIHANARTEDKAEYMAGNRDRLHFLSAARENLTVRVYGDVAVATGRLKQTVQVQPTGDKRDMYIATTQVWRKQGGTWRQLSFQATNVS